MSKADGNEETAVGQQFQQESASLTLSMCPSLNQSLLLGRRRCCDRPRRNWGSPPGFLSGLHSTWSTDPEWVEDWALVERIMGANGQRHKCPLHLLSRFTPKCLSNKQSQKMSYTPVWGLIRRWDVTHVSYHFSMSLVTYQSLHFPYIHASICLPDGLIKSYFLWRAWKSHLMLGSCKA